MTTSLERSWYRPCGWSLLLAPFSLLYGLVISGRRLAYRLGWLKSARVPVPVIVIGNITVGGSGKTPLTAYVAGHLRQHGLNVGIVSRGYGGNAPRYPLRVDPQHTPADVAGDEPLLLASRADATVVVDPKRSRGARCLVNDFGVDIVIADDGLQHYALARDVEIEVVDDKRGYGNGWLLPVGPLRESRSRAQRTDLRLQHGMDGDFSLAPGTLRSVNGDINSDDLETRHLSSLAGQQVHALAGIGSPARFFAMLRGYGIDVLEHAFPDHHTYCEQDIEFGDDKPVLMTEKDAVKCSSWADNRHWYVPVTVHFELSSEKRLEELLEPWIQERLHSGDGGQRETA